MRKTNYRIEGLTCDRCARALSKSLTALTGVRSITISRDRTAAVIEHDENGPEPQEVLAVIGREGYAASGQ